MKRFLLFVGISVLSAAWLSSGCTRSESSDEDSLVEEDSNQPEDLTGEDGNIVPNDNIDPQDNNVPEDGVEPGDNTQPNDNTEPGGTKVKDLQMLADGLNCPEGTAFLNLQDGVVLKGVVVTAASYAATDKLMGFFVADAAGGEYSGIKVVVDNTGNPPAVAVGDVLDLEGSVKEYYCVTEFEASKMTKKSSGAVPVVTTVAASDIPADNAASEKWEGVLVKVENATVTGVDNYGGFTLEGGTQVDNDILGEMPLPKADCAYTSLTGVIDYTYSKYRLLPRTEADLVLDPNVTCDEETPAGSIADVQGSTTSTTCTDQQFVNGPDVSLKGVVVVSKQVKVSNSLQGYFVSDGEGGPNSGVLLVWATADVPTLSVGDVIDAETGWTEYYCLTELKVKSYTKVGDGGTVPAAIVVPEADLVAAATAEKYEGVLVKVENVKVKAKTQYGEAELEGGLLIDTDFGLTTEWLEGTTYASVTGFMSYSFSKYRILPQSDADLVK